MKKGFIIEGKCVGVSIYEKTADILLSTGIVENLFIGPHTQEFLKTLKGKKVRICGRGWTSYPELKLFNKNNS